MKRAGNAGPSCLTALREDHARESRLSLPGLALAEQLYLSVQAKGWGRNGTHALMLALGEMSGIHWQSR